MPLGTTQGRISSNLSSAIPSSYAARKPRISCQSELGTWTSLLCHYATQKFVRVPLGPLKLKGRQSFDCIKTGARFTRLILLGGASHDPPANLALKLQSFSSFLDIYLDIFKKLDKYRARDEIT